MASPETRIRRAAAAYFDQTMPADQLQHEAALREAIDLAGRPVRERFRGLLPPLVLQWVPGDTGFRALARAGRTSLALARAETAPTSGACVITLAWESAAQGLTTLETVRIPQGSRFGQATFQRDLPAGAWVRAVVTSAGGASGVSVALTVDLV